MDTISFGQRKESVFADTGEAPSGPVATPQSFARRIDGLINASGKTQRRIAAELGYDKPNIITMFKQGTTRVPPDKVGPLAHALDADPVELLRLWYEAYEPHMVPVIEQHLGDFLSAREKALIGTLRRRFPEGIPDLDALRAAGAGAP